MLAIACKTGHALRALEETGFSVRGKTPLNDRVYHELRRLMRMGVMQWNEKGGYLLVAGAAGECKDARLPTE